jgi:excinuclease ABC subunit C
LNLTENNIAKGKFKVCLEYHLGNCKGPCEALQTKEDYEEGLRQLKNLLKGKLGPVIQHFKNEMKQHAANMEFEKAEITRKKIEFIENYQSVGHHNTQNGDIDVFFILKEDSTA